MEITHSYKGIGLEYFKTRKGTRRFAAFMIKNMGLDERLLNASLTIVELGAGSGQQTELVEKELLSRGITKYKILAYDKSQRSYSGESPGQLDVLRDRIGRGEISQKVLPIHFDFDGIVLPIESESVDMVYMANVIHHLREKQQVFNEIARMMHKGGRLFILGVVLDYLRNHPLDEFFPLKYEYDARRYPTESQLKDLFHSSGFSYENPIKTGQDNIYKMDRDFLANVENTTVDSVLKMIKDEDPVSFFEGLDRVRKEVERAEIAGVYRIYSSGIGRIFWGIKR